MNTKSMIQDNPGFQRQRRLLLLISILLVFYLGADLQITELVVLGNTFLIQSPGGVGAVLWVLWAYWALRFWQSLREQDFSSLSSAFDKYCVPAFRHFALRSARNDAELLGSIREDLGIDEVLIAGVPDKELANIIERVFPGQYEVAIHVQAYNPTQTSSSFQQVGPYSVSGFSLAAVRTSGAALTAVDTRFFTEYFLPMIVGALPPLVYTVRLWKSAF